MPVIAMDAPKRHPPYGETRSQVAALRQSNPCMTGTAIALQLGISRERVRQILAGEGLPTHGEYTCHRCGRVIRQIQVDVRQRQGLCDRCWRRGSEKPPVWADLYCDYCGKPVRKRITIIQSNLKHGGHGRIFCNRLCNGQWFAANHGFGSPNETAAQAQAHFKWDHEMVRAIYQQQGYQAVMRELGIPYTSLRHIIYGRKRKA